MQSTFVVVIWMTLKSIKELLPYGIKNVTFQKLIIKITKEVLKRCSSLGRKLSIHLAHLTSRQHFTNPWCPIRVQIQEGPSYYLNVQTTCSINCTLSDCIILPVSLKFHMMCVYVWKKERSQEVTSHLSRFWKLTGCPLTFSSAWIRHHNL
jgi:hypothetical protein